MIDAEKLKKNYLEKLDLLRDRYAELTNNKSIDENSSISSSNEIENIVKEYNQIKGLLNSIEELKNGNNRILLKG